MSHDPSKRFWWLNANTRLWDPRTIPIGTVQAYTTHNDDGNKRRVYSNFGLVQPGDLMLGYITTPDQLVSCLFEISKEKHNRSNDGAEIIEFKLIEKFENPVSLDQLRSIQIMSDAEPMRNNQGSLFSLSKDQL